MLKIIILYGKGSKIVMISLVKQTGWVVINIFLEKNEGLNGISLNRMISINFYDMMTCQ